MGGRGYSHLTWDRPQPPPLEWKHITLNILGGQTLTHLIILSVFYHYQRSCRKEVESI